MIDDNFVTCFIVAVVFTFFLVKAAINKPIRLKELDLEILDSQIELEELKHNERS